MLCVAVVIVVVAVVLCRRKTKEGEWGVLGKLRAALGDQADSTAEDFWGRGPIFCQRLAEAVLRSALKTLRCLLKAFERNVV